MDTVVPSSPQVRGSVFRLCVPTLHYSRYCAMVIIITTHTAVRKSLQSFKFATDELFSMVCPKLDGTN
jgi:hypothetical protein